MNFTQTSKFLSLVLRHEPSKIGLTLDSAGWVEISQLLQACDKHGKSITREQLNTIVETNDKKRFAISPDGLRIRASQGHSIKIDLEYQPQVPPETLYHGTSTRFLAAIQKAGLQKMDRHHVHLSDDPLIASNVGKRHGKPLVLTIRAGDMNRNGHLFYRSPNGVWLVDHVPLEYIEVPTARISV